jgi:hypothetical protein
LGPSRAIRRVTSRPGIAMNFYQPSPEIGTFTTDC